MDHLIWHEIGGTGAHHGEMPPVTVESVAGTGGRGRAAPAALLATAAVNFSPELAWRPIRCAHPGQPSLRRVSVSGETTSSLTLPAEHGVSTQHQGPLHLPRLPTHLNPALAPYRLTLTHPLQRLEGHAGIVWEWFS